jgi:hypothetical protein
MQHRKIVKLHNRNIVRQPNYLSEVSIDSDSPVARRHRSTSPSMTGSTLKKMVTRFEPFQQSDSVRPQIKCFISLTNANTS